jgi:(S)-2-hydroxyglutarate dehydrogenase
MQNKRFVIIGAGLVGLATAWRIRQSYPDANITVVEKESGPAQHQSGHNSGVIHSGIYYPPGSLKAQNCLQGYQDLLAFCHEYNIPHEICGKLIVATDAQEAKQLKKLLERGQANGLQGLQLIDGPVAKEIEPNINVYQALQVPATGIVDFVAMAHRLQVLLQNSGTSFLYNCQVTGIEPSQNGLYIHTTNGSLRADIGLNCAGLYSDKIAEMAGLKIQHRIIPFRGDYYELTHDAASRYRGLIYPVPNPDLPFLGVHITRMIHGKVEAGPNAVPAFRREGYRVSDIHLAELWNSISYPGFRKLVAKHSSIGFREILKTMSKRAFVEAVRKLAPDIVAEELLPAPAGVRAQAVSIDGRLIDDFLLLQSPGMIHVCNAPSPAATSCLSIGRVIAEQVNKR